MATKTFEVTGPVPPSTDPPEVISVTAGENPISPSDDTTLTVVGRNYDRVIWSGFGLSASTSPETRTFTAPNNVRVGTTYLITVTLSTDFRSHSGSIAMTIRNVAPIINSFSDIPISIGVRDSFEAFANATDANGDTLRYAWTVTDYQGRNDPDFTQGISPGGQPHSREFQAPSSILGASDAVKTITCTVEDVLPSPHISLSHSRSQDVIVDPDAPVAPNIMHLDAERYQITVDWDPPTNNGGSPITAYRVWIRRLEGVQGIEQEWSTSRSTVVGANIHQFIFALSSGYAITAETNYQIGVEALNTFDINGVTYGGTSERATNTTTTDQLYTQPIDTTPEQNFLPVVDIPLENIGYPITGSSSIRITKTQDVLTVSISGSYSDPDGDPLTVYWTLNSRSTNARLSFDPIGNPYQGETTAEITFPANTNAGTLFLRLNAYDNISNDEFTPVTAAIAIRIVTS